jgi:hypothetical protein
MNWVCPFCNVTQTVTSPKYHTGVDKLELEDNAEGLIALRSKAITCSNAECRKTTIAVELTEMKGSWSQGTYFPKDAKVHWTKQLTPESYAKPLPDYIPRPLRDDYQEACAIRDLSPKASATLARRCLQGMLRDFCGIARSRLIDEIKDLSDAVTHGTAPKGVSIDSIDAIDALRGIGNIGAHMEKDINVIVDVEPREAQLMIELLETLFEDWYIAREKRELRFRSILEAADQKKADKQKLVSLSQDSAGPEPFQSSEEV